MSAHIFHEIHLNVCLEQITLITLQNLYLKLLTISYSTSFSLDSTFTSFNSNSSRGTQLATKTKNCPKAFNFMVLACDDVPLLLLIIKLPDKATSNGILKVFSQNTFGLYFSSV